MHLRHLSDDGQELGEPYVDLLASRGVEDPLILIADQLGKSCRITVVLTVAIRLTMFPERMEHVDRETHVEQMVIINVDEV